MSDVIDKLRKLIRLSGSSNEHEAALALQKAQELAMENGIELASVNCATEKEKVVKGGLEIRESSARRYASILVRDHFGVGIATNDQTVFIYGVDRDIQFASFLLPFLITEMRRLWRKRRAVNPKLRSEADYYRGLAYGLKCRLKQAEASNSSWAITLASKQEEINAAMRGIPDIRPRRRKLSGEEIRAGYADSSKVNINRPLTAGESPRAEIAA